MLRLALIAILLLCSGACENASPIPPLVAGLSDGEATEARFDARIKKHFAVGTSVRSLLDELRSQGFEVKPAYDMADYRIGDGFCEIVWSVRWRAKGGKLLEAAGLHFQRCP